MKFLGFLFILSSALSAHAATVNESFTSNINKGTGGMVWNISRGELHPPLVVIGYDSGSGSTDYSFDVGDGRHGAFTNSSEYSSLSCASIAGSVITINTDACPDLQFTNFNLLASWTIRPTGSKPLVIRSQGAVTIDGDIDCSGENGLAATSSVVTALVGGQGHCGGGNGGSSVLPNVAPAIVNRGGAGGTLVTGGGGGLVQTAGGGIGGGGGGAYVKNFAGGTDSADGTGGGNSASVVQANVGTNYRDDDFIDDVSGAGSGGGGGSGFEVGADPDNSSGGSGGAGGGSILIYAVEDITVNGSILADGGNGGAVGGSLKGGAGGGGGGGSIVLMTVGDIINEGTISAIGGFGGASAVNAVGGNGYWGRTWVVEKDGFAGGTQIETPETKLSIPGDVRYETGVSYTVTSAAIDLGNSKPKINGATETIVDQNTSTVTFEISFGASSSDTSLTNHDVPSAYVGQEVGRFGQFQFVVTNTGSQVPVRITNVSFDFDEFTQGEFEFVGACGAVGPMLSKSGPVVVEADRGNWLRSSQNSSSNHEFQSLLFFALFSLPVVVWLGLRRNYQR